ncbi:uncharacterized protein LOC143888509 [Tasmannia lanceolata]|uniref:uncharacterized protein LOC143888509 n=1 Tax=Tasmannia lanceolata TaxID=3420 RepID=UPI004064082F
MVTSWILNVISSDISNSILHGPSSYDVWMDLHDRFSQSQAPRIFELTHLIATLQQENSSILTYFSKLKSYWDELSSISAIPPCSCGASKSAISFEHQQRLIKNLMGLNDPYSSVRSQILLMDPLPPMNKAYNLLLQEERQCNLLIQLKQLIETSAMAASNTRTFTQ